MIELFAISYGWHVISGNLSKSAFFKGVGQFERNFQTEEASPTNHCWCQQTTLWTEKTHQNVLSYLPQNAVDSDKPLYTLSWMNLRYSSLNIFRLNWIVSLHYLVKLSVAFCKWTPTGTANQKTHQIILSHRLQNQADSDKILYLLSWRYLPQSIITVFHLT